MPTLKKFLVTLGLAALLGASVILFSAFDGYTNIQTESQVALNAVTAASGHSVVMRDIGQSQHMIDYCVTVGVGVNSFSIWLEASPDATKADASDGTWFRISDIGTALSSCHEIEAGGYHRAIRIAWNNYSHGPNSSVTAWYSATTAPISNQGQAGVANRSAGSAIYGNSASVGGAYFNNIQTINPGAGADLGHIVMRSGLTGPPFIYLDKLLITPTATATLTLNAVGAEGSGCTLFLEAPMRGGTYPIPVSQAQLEQCSTPPAISLTPAYTIIAPANQTTIIDLSGFNIAGNDPVNGIMGWELRAPASVTGTINATWQWFQQ